MSDTEVLARLEAWQGVDPENRGYELRQYAVRLHAAGELHVTAFRYPAVARVWTGVDPSDNSTVVGTNEGHATLPVAITAALDLWERLYPLAVA